MNERIKELFVQALEEFKAENKYATIIVPNPLQEKFAELLIRECMDLLEDYTTDVHVGGIQYNVVSAEETLQKHFGLE